MIINDIFGYRKDVAFKNMYFLCTVLKQSLMERKDVT